MEPVIINVNGKKYNFDKNKLLEASEFFKVMYNSPFSDGLKGNGQMEITLDADILSFEMFYEIFNKIGTLALPEPSVWQNDELIIDCYYIADYLRSKQVIEYCESLMLPNIEKYIAKGYIPRSEILEEIFSFKESADYIIINYPELLVEIYKKYNNSDPVVSKIICHCIQKTLNIINVWERFSNFGLPLIEKKETSIIEEIYLQCTRESKVFDIEKCLKKCKEEREKFNFERKIYNDFHNWRDRVDKVEACSQIALFSRKKLNELKSRF